MLKKVIVLSLCGFLVWKALPSRSVSTPAAETEETVAENTVEPAEAARAGGSGFLREKGTGGGASRSPASVSMNVLTDLQESETDAFRDTLAELAAPETAAHTAQLTGHFQKNRVGGALRFLVASQRGEIPIDDARVGDLIAQAGEVLGRNSAEATLQLAQLLEQLPSATYAQEKEDLINAVARIADPNDKKFKAILLAEIGRRSDESADFSNSLPHVALSAMRVHASRSEFASAEDLFLKNQRGPLAESYLQEKMLIEAAE